MKNKDECLIKELHEKKSALAGNRTRVARGESEHSTTEPPDACYRLSPMVHLNY